MLKNKNIQQAICIILLILYSASIVLKTFQNDTFFTIVVGNKILKEGFYTDETFVWHEGLKFANIKWLFDITIAVIYNNFGFDGIYIFVMIMSALIAVMIFYIFQKRKHNLWLSFFSTLITIFFLKGGLAARAQIVSYLIFIIEYYLINRLFETQNKKYSIIIILLGILMANVHGPLFPMYIVIFIPYLSEIILSRFKIFNEETSDRKIIIEKREGIKLFVITMILASLTGFLTPLKNILAYTDMFKTIGSIANEMIGELIPITILGNYQFYIIAIISIGIIGFTKIKIRLSDALFLLGYGLLAFANRRNEFYFVIFGMIALTRLIEDFLKQYNIYDIKINDIMKKVGFTFIILATVLFSSKTFINEIKNEYLAEYCCPEYAADFLIDNYELDKIRLYNGFNEGAYLEFRNIPVFIDSRAEIYIKEFNDTEILEDFNSLSNWSIHYNNFFDKYDITHVLISGEYIKYIREDNKWNLVYQDDEYCIFERERI